MAGASSVHAQELMKLSVKVVSWIVCVCILMMIRPGGGVASKNKEKKKRDDGSITGNNYRHYNTW